MNTGRSLVVEEGMGEVRVECVVDKIDSYV